MKKLLFIFTIFLPQIVFAQNMPKNPIVLIHGLLGGSNLGIHEYWGDIPQLLKKQGAKVYVANLQQTASSYKRGRLLHKKLVQWGHSKYNLIGHSQGGIDARYVLGHYPDLISSVTTISSPHKGSLVADKIYAQKHSNKLKWAGYNLLGNFIGHAVASFNHNTSHQNFAGAIKSLTTKSMTKFNQEFPAGMNRNPCESGQQNYFGIKLYSWGSTSSVSHPSDILTFFLDNIGDSVFLNEQNDGLVSVCSMMFGKWLGAIENANHATVIGGVIRNLPFEDKNFLEKFYLQHAYQLYIDGL